MAKNKDPNQPSRWLEESSLFRVLYYELWFRVALVLFLILALAVGLGIPKIWTVSPEGFSPAVKVSGLDWLQSKSLRRSGERLTREGDFERAVFSWQAAIVNYPVDPALFEGAIRNATLHADPPSKVISSCVANIVWLQRLTNTNVVHLPLVAEALDQFELYGLVRHFVEPKIDQADKPTTAIYAKALFHLGSIEEFAEFVEGLDDDFAGHPTIKLYDAAYRAGWAAPGHVNEGLSYLSSIPLESESYLEALRLSLLVAGKRGDLPGLESIMAQLEKLGSDDLIVHTAYWKALIRAGDTAKARELAVKSEIDGSSALGVIQHAQLLEHLGESDRAHDAIRGGIERFPFDDRLPVSFGQKLIERQEWEKLRLFALNLRTDEKRRISPVLGAFSLYFEGRAEKAIGRDRVASGLFSRVASQTLRPHIGSVIALGIMKAGFPGDAQKILNAYEEAEGQNPRYWHLRFSAAYDIGDADELLWTAKRAFDLETKNFVYVNNLAAALLIRREQPDLAVRLTFEMMNRSPNSLHARINHSLALLLAYRTAEAEELLGSINVERLIATERNAFLLALFQVHQQQSNWVKANDVAKNIDIDSLMVPQREWLLTARKQVVAQKTIEAE